MVPGYYSLFSKLFGRGKDPKKSATPVRTYEKSGEWPKLSLVERSCVEEPWTKIEGEVRVFPLISAHLTN